MPLRNLIAIVTLISYTACAAKIKEIRINEPLTVEESAVVAPVLNGLSEVDPDNPPKDGLWMNWQDAIAMANFIRKERLNSEARLILAEKDRDISIYKLKMAEKQLKDDNSPAKSWWLTWGFPIGMAIGVIVGVVTPIAIQGAQK